MKKFCAGIHILVKKGSEYLVLKRGKDDDADADAWDLPGGGIKFGEQPLAAAVREVYEEVGIQVKISKILPPWAILYQGQWSIELTAEAQYLSGKMRLSEEHSEYRWINKKELLKISPKSAPLKYLLKNL